MFGIHRYVLSLLVMVGHLAPLWSSWCGYYAVFAFYLLSGFLMTKVLRRRYGGSSAGVVRFLANRALRIHPPYWAVLGLTLGLLALWPVDVPRLHPSTVHADRAEAQGDPREPCRAAPARAHWRTSLASTNVTCVARIETARW